jgi:hypothetical protein
MLCQSALEVETSEFLQIAHFLVNRCHTLIHYTNNANRRDPPRLAQGRVSSATAIAISNIRMLEPQAQNKPRTAPRTGNGVTEHRSVVHPAIAGETPPRLRHARTMFNVVPVLRADHPRGLNLIRRTVSAPTTVADLIGDLAALHHRFVSGQVVGSGFCHSE